MWATATAAAAIGLVGCGSEAVVAAPPTTFVGFESTTTTVDPYGVIAADADGKVLAAIEADRSGADATAVRLMATLDRRECVPASSVDLGPLTSAASWEQVCRYAVEEGLSLSGVDHTPNVVFSDTHPVSPDTCFRRLVGNWWSWYSGGGDPVTPCMPGYTFQGA
jgi:hypothetical protein